MVQQSTRAFTLVELSIVLVILGLLTGGILTGQSLIKAAELRSIIVEKDRYAAAAQSFRDKYRSLPGDVTNATAFWGDGPAGVYACDVPAGGAAHYDVCNGNGNGLIGYISLTSMSGTEMIQFWTQLALAGMIEGSYSGQEDLVYNMVQAGGATAIMPLYYNETTPTTPTSRAKELRWYTGYNDSVIIHYFLTPITFQAKYGHYLLLGRSANSGGNPVYTSSLTSEEVWNIDRKTDDEKPGVGKVLAYPYTCTTATNAMAAQAAVAEYVVTNQTAQCGVIFANVY